MSIFTILVVNQGVIAACIPFSKPFADYVQSGILGAGLRIKTAPQQSPNITRGQALELSSRPRQQGGARFLRIPDIGNAETLVMASKGHSEDPEFHEGSFGSDDMIIKQTREYAVHSEPQ